MPERQLEVLRGTLDLLILKAVSWGPLHAYPVAQWIERATDDVLRIEEGTLYRAKLHVETKDWTRYAAAIFSALDAPAVPT